MTEKMSTLEIAGIAFRNILRNRRRTVLNMIALTMGMSIMIAAAGWMRGYFTSLYDGMISLDTGHVQLLDPGYPDEERRFPLDLVLTGYKKLHSEISERKGVAAVSGRIRYELELGNGREYMQMNGRGVEFENEFKVTGIRRFTDFGDGATDLTTLGAGAGILIGKTAADLLGLTAGSTAFLRVRDAYGAPNTTALTVSGIFSTGYPLFDRYMIFSSMKDTAELLRLEDAVTHMAVRLESGRNPEQYAEALRNDGIFALEWKAFAESMVAAVEADIGAFLIMIAILFLLIVLGILNSMSMAVRERYREIGTMRAIGMKKRQLSALLLMEGVSVAILSAAAAAIIGGGFAAYIQFVGFDIAQFMPPELPIPFGERFYGDYHAVDFLIATAVGLASAAAGTLIPIHRAANLKIAETLRGRAV